MPITFESLRSHGISGDDVLLTRVCCWLVDQEFECMSELKAAGPLKNLCGAGGLPAETISELQRSIAKHRAPHEVVSGPVSVALTGADTILFLQTSSRRMWLLAW